MLQADAAGEASASVGQRVSNARAMQLARYAGCGVRTNAELTPALMANHCELSHDARALLSTAAARLVLSARGYDRVRKVARTIADLGGADAGPITREHVAEALQFRMLASGRV